MQEYQKLFKLMGDAIENGEIIRIRYYAGSQPGTVRDIRPVAVSGDRVRAIDVSSPVPKLFLFSHLELATLDEELSYVPRRTKRQIIANPETVVAEWRFYIPMPAFAPAFDIVSSRRVRTNLITKKKDYVWVWTQGVPPVYSFEPGDIFYSPGDAATLAWSDVPFHTALQVDAADGDKLSFHLFEFERGVLRKSSSLQSSLEDFVRLLREGPSGEIMSILCNS